MSVVIDNHQLLGAARIKRVSVLNGTIIGLLAVSVLMAVKNEYFICGDIYKGIHDDENNVCL